MEPESIEPQLAVIRSSRSLALKAIYEISFNESQDLLFHRDQVLPRHSNGMRFCAFEETGQELMQEIYYSVGGGFILREGESSRPNSLPPVRYPFSSGADLLRLGEEHGLPFWKISLENEKCWRDEQVIRAYVERIWAVMQECVERGL